MTDQPAHDGIVVLGAPRSGTTLMRRILNAHPDIACPGETTLLAACARFLQSDIIAEGLDVGVVSGLQFAGFDEEYVLKSLREFAFGFHREYARREGKSRWASKSAFDVYYLDTIEKLCANDAYFVCLQRHGLDVACSLKDLCDANGAYLSELHTYVKRYPSPLEAFSHAWVDATLATRGFVARHPENALLVKYEDLTADPETVTKQIAAFVRVDWSPEWLAGVMAVPESYGLGDFKTYGKDRIDTDSVGRWRTLSEHTIGMMARICNPILEASGYAPIEAKERSVQEARRRHELRLRVSSRQSKAKKRATD
jgi:protein-tyrosine sulfotransferase